MWAWFQSADPLILMWLALVVVFVLAELITVGLASIWFAAGALGALLVAAAGGGIGLQIAVFFVISVGLLAATRPWAKTFVNARTQRTNADSLIGEEIRIGERVSNMDQTGTAVVRGQEWTVRAENEQEIIEAGATARVVAIRGVKLIVKGNMETKNQDMDKED